MTSVVQLTQHLGVEIQGVDLAKRTRDANISDIVTLLDKHEVVVIRDQTLAVDQFVAFSRLVGPLAIHPLAQYSKPGFPELMVNSNIIENGKPLGLADGGQRWHTDGAYLETPHHSTILYALEVPIKDGIALGDTMFASTTAAYDALGAAMKNELLRLRATNFPNLARERGGQGVFNESQRKKFAQGAEHPVVRIHSRTAKKCIYVC